MLVTRVERIEAVTPSDGGFRILRFDLEATVAGSVDPSRGMVVNIIDMKKKLRQDVVSRIKGRCLDGKNGAPDFRTPEALARGVWEMLGGALGGVPLHRVRLVGHPSPIVEYAGDRQMNVTRVYEFSASHRLHSPQLSDAENERLFGKCNNPSGHGHNYVLEVTLRGEPEEGCELIPAAEFDRIVETAVVDRWDHRNLNQDLPEFDGVNPTAEEIARIAWSRIGEALGHAAAADARLHRIKLRETERNHVEYFGE
jgi:6-pyruvoyltetrahydropterin/6-carboxytetrahydropterin synthase